MRRAAGVWGGGVRGRGQFEQARREANRETGREGRRARRVKDSCWKGVSRLESELSEIWSKEGRPDQDGESTHGRQEPTEPDSLPRKGTIRADSRGAVRCWEGTSGRHLNVGEQVPWKESQRVRRIWQTLALPSATEPQRSLRRTKRHLSSLHTHTVDDQSTPTSSPRHTTALRLDHPSSVHPPPTCLARCRMWCRPSSLPSRCRTALDAVPLPSPQTRRCSSSECASSPFLWVDLEGWGEGKPWLYELATSSRATCTGPKVRIDPDGIKSSQFG